ncbi:conserved hypothetical protein, membrane [Candidatus Magnetomorum sp. HK-1]|nr:conserved hypothetical protein, membrane [Candidatus Magnetomorum sp. HK-1]
MNTYFQRLLGFFLICNFFLVNSYVFAEELTNQIKLNLVDRLARIEEGQKSIIIEMRTRFEAVDKQFDAVDKRFEAVEKQFEAVDKRFEAVDKRFESIDKRFEAIDKRFEAIDKRFDSLEKRIDFLVIQIGQIYNFNLAIIAAVIALIGYIIWDRKTAFDKAFTKASERFELLIQNHIEQSQASPFVRQEIQMNDSASKNLGQNTRSSNITDKRKQEVLIPQNIQEKFNQITAFMNQFPEMQKMMRANEQLA